MKKNKVGVSFFVIILLAFGLVALLTLVRDRQDIRGRAEGEFRLLFNPTQALLPATVKVMLDPGSTSTQLVFAKVVVKFPKDQLTYTAGTVSDAFKNVLSISSPGEVQNTPGTEGKITIIAGVNPETDSAITSTTEFAALSFDKATDQVSPSTDNVTFDTNESEIIVLPNTKIASDAIKKFGVRLYTVSPTGVNQDKERQNKDLGLVLTRKRTSDGKDFIHTEWPRIDAIERPNFLNFSFVVRRKDENELVSDPSERKVNDEECASGKCSRDIVEAGNLTPGEYYVNLRGIFKQKIVIQTPRKYFKVESGGRIIILP